MAPNSTWQIKHFWIIHEIQLRHYNIENEEHIHATQKNHNNNDVTFFFFTSKNKNLHELYNWNIKRKKLQRLCTRDLL